MSNRVGPLFLLLVSLCASVHAETVDLSLRDGGRTFRGEIVGGNFGGWVEIRLADSGASIALEVSELAPESILVVYRHRRDALGPNSAAADRMALAEFCLAHGLYLEAISEFRGATQADPGLAGRAADGIREANDRIADRIADHGFELLAAGNSVQSALELFEKVLANYPDSIAARRVEPEVGPLRERLARERANAAPPPGGAPPPDPPHTPGARALERLAREVEEADAAYRSAVEWEGRSQPGKALASYKKAERAYDAIFSAAAAIRRTLAAEEMESLLAIEKDAKERALRLWLAMAHYYAAGHQLQEARAYVNRALATHPDHPGANELRDKITEELIRGR